MFSEVALLRGSFYYRTYGALQKLSLCWTYCMFWIFESESLTHNPLRCVLVEPWGMHDFRTWNTFHAANTITCACHIGHIGSFTVRNFSGGGGELNMEFILNFTRGLGARLRKLKHFTRMYSLPVTLEGVTVRSCCLSWSKIFISKINAISYTTLSRSCSGPTG